MIRAQQLERLIGQVKYAARRSEKIAEHPHVLTTVAEPTQAGQSPKRSYTYLAISEDVEQAHRNNAVLLNELALLLETVKESEEQMRARILQEMTDYLQGKERGEKL